MRKMRSSREAAEKDPSETEQIDEKNDIQMGEYRGMVIHGFHTWKASLQPGAQAALHASLN
jgi:hypothetical protein